jgi:hypothetical protein
MYSDNNQVIGLISFTDPDEFCHDLDPNFQRPDLDPHLTKFMAGNFHLLKYVIQNSFVKQKLKPKP